MQSELRKCFINVIKSTEGNIRNYGEALTYVEPLERLKEAGEEKTNMMERRVKRLPFLRKKGNE